MCTDYRPVSRTFFVCFCILFCVLGFYEWQCRLLLYGSYILTHSWIVGTIFPMENMASSHKNCMCLVGIISYWGFKNTHTGVNFQQNDCRKSWPLNWTNSLPHWLGRVALISNRRGLIFDEGSELGIGTTLPLISHLRENKRSMDS